MYYKDEWLEMDLQELDELANKILRIYERIRLRREFMEECKAQNSKNVLIFPKALSSNKNGGEYEK